MLASDHRGDARGGDAPDAEGVRVRDGGASPEDGVREGDEGQDGVRDREDEAGVRGEDEVAGRSCTDGQDAAGTRTSGWIGIGRFRVAKEN